MLERIEWIHFLKFIMAHDFLVNFGKNKKIKEFYYI